MKFFLGFATLAAAGPIVYPNGYPNNQYGSNYRPSTGYNPASYNPTGYNPTGYNPNGHNPNCNTYLQNGQTQPCWQQRQCNSVRTDGTPVSCQLQDTSRYQTKVCARNSCRCIDASSGMSRPNNYCGITANPTGYNPNYNPNYKPNNYNPNNYNPNCNTYVPNGQTQPCWRQRQCKSLRTDGTPITCQLQDTSRYQTKVCVRNFCRCIDANTGLSRPNTYCGINSD